LSRHHPAEHRAQDKKTPTTMAQDKNKQSLDSKIMLCGNCSAPEGSEGVSKLSACARCATVVYCSKECQKAHWIADHKRRCIDKANDEAPSHTSQKVRKGIAFQAAAAGEECSICLGSLVGTTVTTLQCSHVLHAECAAELFKPGVKRTCPLCRIPIQSELEQRIGEATRRFVAIDQMVERGEASWSALPAEAQSEIDAAVSEWRIAADHGLEEAQYKLGILFSTGRGVAQSDKEAAKWYKMAAEQGNPEAQFNLGHFFATGRGMLQRDEKAAQWFRKAADQGHVDAQQHLGSLYMQGRGVPQSNAQMVRWWQKAAEQGDMDSQNNLGNLYAQGTGVPQSHAEAMEWWGRAAEQGQMNAQCMKGLFLLKGNGVAKNQVEGLKLLRKAADQGHPEAKMIVAGFK